LEFEVESLMFDVDGFKFKAIASNIIHQTLKRKGPRMMAETFVRQPLFEY